MTLRISYEQSSWVHGENTSLILGKKILDQKPICVRRILGPKIFYVQMGKKNLWSVQIFGTKKVGLKNIWAKTNFRPKNCWSKKILVQKISVKNNLSSKKLFARKLLGLKKFWIQK